VSTRLHVAHAILLLPVYDGRHFEDVARDSGNSPWVRARTTRSDDPRVEAARHHDLYLYS
jgi:hypothetical protein